MSVIPTSSLFARLAAGGSAVAAAQAVRLLLRFGSMVTLARLLSPAEFGLFGIASLLYGLLQTTRDLGLTSVAMQQGDLTDRARNQFFWLQGGAGLLVAMITAAIAPAAAAYFEQTALTPMLGALSGAFLLSGCGGQFRVELSRSLRFRTISAIDVAGLAAGIGVALGAASLGARHWSLVAMVLVQELVTLAGLFVFAAWRPQGWPDFSDTGRSIRAGLHLSGFSLVYYCTQMLDQAWVASRFGSHALGLYGRAWQLGTLPTHGLIAGLSGWMTQGLVKLRDDPENFRAWCRRILNALAYLCAPLGAVLVVAGEPVLGSLLGPQWLDAAPALRWLALTLPLQPWAFAELWIMTACQQERRLLLWSLLRLALVVGALSCVPSSDFADIAAIVAALQWLLFPISVGVVTCATSVRWHDVVVAHGWPLLLSLLMGASLCATKTIWSGQTSGVALVLITAELALISGVFCLLSPRARQEMGAGFRLLVGRA